MTNVGVLSPQSVRGPSESTAEIEAAEVRLGVSLPLSPQIFGLLNAEGLILEYCISYFQIRVWGFPLTLLTFAIMGIFQGLQNTGWPMLIAIKLDVSIEVINKIVKLFGNAVL